MDISQTVNKSRSWQYTEWIQTHKCINNTFTKRDKVLYTALTIGTHASNHLCALSNCTLETMTSHLSVLVSGCTGFSHSHSIEFRNLLNGCFWLDSSSVQKLTLKHFTLPLHVNWSDAEWKGIAVFHFSSLISLLLDCCRLRVPDVVACSANPDGTDVVNAALMCVLGREERQRASSYFYVKQISMTCAREWNEDASIRQTVWSVRHISFRDPAEINSSYSLAGPWPLTPQTHGW